MNQKLLQFLVCFSVFFAGVNHCYGQACNSSCLSAITSSLNTDLTQVRATYANRNMGGSTAIRDLTNGALADLILNGPSSGAEAASWLQYAFSRQDVNTCSSTFGDLFFNSGDSVVTDTNATEFGLMAVGVIFPTYESQLPAGTYNSIAPALMRAMTALLRHTSTGSIAVSYTNMYLMNTVDMMLVGQRMGATTALATAHNQLIGWLNYTMNTGIHEFDSPTYSGTQMESIVEGYRYASSPADKQNYQTALDYIWLDMAANFYPASYKIAGANSRNYDFRASQGALQAWIEALGGWTSNTGSLNSLELEQTMILDNNRAGGYTVPSSTTTLALSASPREVVSTWDTTSFATRYNQMMNNVTLSCASGYYGPQDKLFSASFVGSRSQPLVSTVLDSSGNPYGTVQTTNSAGQSKPSHLEENLGCALANGYALLTTDFDSSRLSSSNAGLFTNILFPTVATVAINGTPVSLNLSSPGGSISLQSTDIVTIQVGSGVIGFRLLNSDPVNGYNPTWAITTDANGLPYNTARVVLTHLPNYQASTNKGVRVAFLAATNDMGNAATVYTTLDNAAPNKSTTNGLWTTSAVMQDGTTLQVARSYDNRLDVGTSLVNGAAPPQYTLATISPSGVVTNLANMFWTQSNHFIQP
jgi:hypothetical protein